VAPRRDLELLRRYLSVLAVNAAGTAAESALWSAAGINAKTAQACQALFQRMFVLGLVPAWFSDRIKRLVKAPKRCLVDPALVAAVLGLGREAILYGPTCWAACWTPSSPPSCAPGSPPAATIRASATCAMRGGHGYFLRAIPPKRPW
jgi:hypothetical protein